MGCVINEIAIFITILCLLINMLKGARLLAYHNFSPIQALRAAYPSVPFYTPDFENAPRMFYYLFFNYCVKCLMF